MSNYRRWRVSGGVFFFTIVTSTRTPLFLNEVNRRFLRESFQHVRCLNQFELPAMVLLPDHLHMLMQLPPGDTDYSLRVRQIKTLFTKRLSELNETRKVVSMSRKSRGEHNVWQRRFYEHTVRDEDDFQRCADYIHVNPVKHRLVARVSDWKWSSFHQWVAEGYYNLDWGTGSDWFGDEFKKFE